MKFLATILLAIPVLAQDKPKETAPPKPIVGAIPTPTGAAKPATPEAPKDFPIDESHVLKIQKLQSDMKANDAERKALDGEKTIIQMNFDKYYTEICVDNKLTPGKNCVLNLDKMTVSHAPPQK